MRIRALSEYFHRPVGDLHCLVVNYADVSEQELERALAELPQRLDADTFLLPFSAATDIMKEENSR